MAKTVLITGASSGFGNLAAKKFQREGWNVVATMRSPDKDRELVSLDNVVVVRLDVTDRASVDDAVSRSLARFGTIDVLVNNAGFGGTGYLEQFSEEQMRRMFDTNVFGVVRASQAVLPVMRRQKSGTIVNVSSSAGYFGLSLHAIYCATKFAVEGLTDAMALEYKPFNIAVKAVAPGGYGTNFNASTDSNIEIGDEELRYNAQKLAGHFAATAAQLRQQSGADANPQEVADMIFKCATSNAPVHNICGADAEQLIKRMSAIPRQDFFNEMAAMLTPKN